MSNIKIIVLVLFFCVIASCTRSVSVNVDEKENTPATVMWSGAYPMAVLRTGEHPLWFQLTEEGPVHIESIEDVVSISALVPWTYALHICFLQERAGSLVMVINRDGFLKISPDNESMSWIALYRFPGGEFWREYTVGGFVYYNDEPAALLYLDNRFMETDLPQPRLRTWSFNMNSNTPFPVQIPALERFSSDEGWEVDSLRLGAGGLFYYRAARRSGSSMSVRFFRTADLAKAGEEISVDTFFNSFPRNTEFANPALPQLPEGFVYTGVGQVNDSLFASWEEQGDFSIGAAGFVVLRL